MTHGKAYKNITDTLWGSEKLKASLGEKLLSLAISVSEGRTTRAIRTSDVASDLYHRIHKD